MIPAGQISCCAVRRLRKCEVAMSSSTDVVNDMPDAYRIQYLQFLQSPVQDTARTELMPSNLSVRRLSNSSSSEDTRAVKSSADDRRVLVKEKLKRSCLLGRRTYHNRI